MSNSGEPLDTSSGRAVTAPTCPHLGLRHDPDGYYSFPSTENRCYHCKLPATPLLEHQATCCLSGKHKDCRVYWQSRKKPFPVALQAPDEVRPAQSALVRTALAIAVGLTAVGYVAFRYVPRALSRPQADPRPAASVTPKPSLTSFPTATNSPVPTSTRIPASTPAAATHDLEVSFEIDGHELLMHKVGAGDMFETIDAKYETTPDVLRALNYSLTRSLLGNTVILIAPGLQTVDPALPSFWVRQVDRPAVTIDGLAKEYHVDITALRHYNRCSDDCLLSVGDWILIPVMGTSTATP